MCALLNFPRLCFVIRSSRTQLKIFVLDFIFLFEDSSLEFIPITNSTFPSIFIPAHKIWWIKNERSQPLIFILSSSWREKILFLHLFQLHGGDSTKEKKKTSTSLSVINAISWKSLHTYLHQRSHPNESVLEKRNYSVLKLLCIGHHLTLNS